MKKTKKRKQKPKTFNKTTETINLPSFVQTSYLWNILWQTWWELQVPNETRNLWACALAVNSAQVRERITPTTRQGWRNLLKHLCLLLLSKAFLLPAAASRRQILQIQWEWVGETCCPHFWEILGQAWGLSCAQEITSSPRNKRSGTLHQPVFNGKDAWAKHTECFPTAAEWVIQGFTLQTPSAPFLLLVQLVNIIAMAESLASQEKVPNPLLS